MKRKYTEKVRERKNKMNFEISTKDKTKQEMYSCGCHVFNDSPRERIHCTISTRLEESPVISLKTVR